MSKYQSTNNIMMIRPANFGFNDQTAENNYFQNPTENKYSEKSIALKVIEEFDNMVEILRSKGVNVIVIQDTKKPPKPDAIFPNNWISFHENGAVITYPMFAPNRRIERRESIVEDLSEKFDVKRRYTFEHYEEDEMFLEGTGSMLFDRIENIVYAGLSKRTDPRLIDKFCVLMDAERVIFHTEDRNGDAIYHTNVMMALGEDFVVLCKESIPNKKELDELLASLNNTGKEIVDISFDQMESFTGNMLQVRNIEGDTYIVLSQAAYDSLTIQQVKTLSRKSELLPIDIPTIEYYGGGSVRCMMAEVFLEDKEE